MPKLEKVARPEGRAALDEIVGVGLMGEKGFKLNHLAVVEPRILIVTPSFSKGVFFGSQAGVEIKNRLCGEVLNEISDWVPASQDLVLSSLHLSQPMLDEEIRGEIGMDNLLAPDQWAQVLYYNLTRQSKGEKEGYFEARDSFFNLSYIRLGNGKVVVASAYLGFLDRAWHLTAVSLSVFPWHGGIRVFAAADPL